MFRKRTHSQNYYSNRGNELRSRRAFSNKFNFIKNLVFKILVVLLFGGALYAILFTPVLAVKNVVVEGNKAINSNEINEAVLSFASQKIWKIFNNNLLALNPADLENAVKSRFGNIDTVKIEKKYPQTVKIVIKEKPADISWCNKIKVEKVTNEKSAPSDEVSASEIPQCYLSDEAGIIYEKIGDNAANGSVKVFRDEPIEIGMKISDDSLKNFIRSIFYNFNAKTGLNLSYLYILPPASRELHLVTSDSWKIYFDLNRGAGEQIEVLNEFIKKGLKEDDKKNMDYIDLRVMDRIYYKAKNEVKK